MNFEKIFLIVIFFVICSFVYPSEIKISGFGTLGMDVIDQVKKYDGTINHKPNFDYNTNLGVNLSAPLGSNVLFFSQFIYGHSVTSSQTSIGLDWMFIKYRFSDKLELDFGIIKQPLWLISSYKDVRFLQPWNRNPEVLYSMIPFNDFNGSNLSYSFSLGDWRMVLSGFLGKADFSISAATGDSSILGGKIEADYGDLHLLASLAQLAELTGTSSGVPIKIDYNYRSFGFVFDNEMIFLMGEYVHATTQNLLAIFPRLQDIFGEAFYLTVGKKIKSVSGHMTFLKCNTHLGRVRINPSTSVKAPNYRSRSLIFTFTYHVSPQSNLKVQWEREFFKPGDTGLFDDFIGREANHYGLSYNFIF